MTVFKWVEQILVYRKDWSLFTEAEQKVFQPYMINRILSMDKKFINIVNYFQKYSIGLLESKDVYKWYCSSFPKGKKWNRYIKSRIKEKYDKWVIDIIRRHYEISEKECISCLELLYRTPKGKIQLKTILEMYGSENKKIKKLKLEK